MPSSYYRKEPSKAEALLILFPLRCANSASDWNQGKATQQQSEVSFLVYLQYTFWPVFPWGLRLKNPATPPTGACASIAILYQHFYL